MATAKCLRRQAATCASLADATYDEESRERYKRLEQLYLQLADSEDPPHDEAAPFIGDDRPEAPAHRSH